MTNPKYVELLKLRVNDWNKWREYSYAIRANLRGADLRKANLSEVNLSEADLCGADLCEANLHEADLSETDLTGASLTGANLRRAYLRRTNLRDANLSGADLSGANLRKACLRRANLSGADLSGANLSEVNLREANLSGANLSGANLSGADLNEADLTSSSLIDTALFGTDLSGCSIYGGCVWNARTDENTLQKNLVITKKNAPIVSVDSLEIAQFINLMLNNQQIRALINSITTKLVLILGRFTPERKPLLETLREQLRNHNFIPVLFDCDQADNLNFIETVSTLAQIARFIIADFTDSEIILQEAQYIIPNISIPFVPIFSKSSGFEPLTLYDLRKGNATVIRAFGYEDTSYMIENLYEKIIKPAETKAEKLSKNNSVKAKKRPKPSTS
jgi:uncharacterized protein YjbI with pentapeptide repeats